MAAYYNEHDKFAASWLRELIKARLIADGEVDERDIQEVSADDVRGFTQCHWFAGIGGWSYALRLARFQDTRPAWTASLPCQPFSSAARGRNVDAGDVYQSFRRLVVKRTPGVVFGEQVVKAAWAEALCADLESLDYKIGAVILPAVLVGQDHARSRFYFAGHTNRHGKSSLPVDAKVARLPRYRSDAGSMGAKNGVSRDMVALSGFGNAIVPQVAAEVIRAYMEVA